MAPCPIATAFNHSLLIEGSLCPFCNSGPAGPSSAASSAVAPSQPQATHSGQSQYTPIKTGTLAALRQTSGNANAARAGAISTTRVTNLASQPQLPSIYKFAVRVAHASYIGDPPMTKWTVWTEGWTVAITYNSLTSFYTFKDTLRHQGQAQFIPYFDGMTRPQRYGYWTLSTNYLDPKSPAPQLWCTWESEYTIQDIITLQGYKLAAK
jgi:hypothetical protein